MSTARQSAQTNQILSREKMPAPKRATGERLIKVAYIGATGDRQEAWMKESTVPLFLHRGVRRGA